MESVFLQLINLSLAVGMVILLAALVRPLLVRRYRRALLRGIWAVLTVRLLLPVSLPAAAVEMELPASLGQPVAARVAAPLPGGESESIQSGGQELPAASEEKAAAVPAALPAASPLELAALVWLTGAAVLAVVSIGRHLAWKRRVLALAQPVSDARQQVFLRACRACGVRPPRLLCSPAVDTPLAFGLVRPMVLLPEREWANGELYAVLCHELCHIRRKDLWLQMLLRAACWVHWFNPAVWLLARLAGEDMELACDERVLRLADAPAGRDYGRALLETACRVRPAGHTSCFSAAGRSLSRRLGAIVVQVKKRPGRPLLVLALAAALGCTGLAACTVATEKEQPSSQPPAPSQPQPTPADETGYDSFSLYPTGGGVLDGPGLPGHPAGEAPETHHLCGGAQLVGQVDHQGLLVPGHFPGQRPHVGDDDVLLHGGETAAQGPGVLQGHHGVGEALVAVVGRLFPGIVEVEVVEEPRPGGGPVVQAPAAGQAIGHVGHAHRVLIAGGAGVVGELPHGTDLRGIQQVLDTAEKELIVDVVHGNHLALP